MYNQHKGDAIPSCCSLPCPGKITRTESWEKARVSGILDSAYKDIYYMLIQPPPPVQNSYFTLLDVYTLLTLETPLTCSYSSSFFLTLTKIQKYVVFLLSIFLSYDAVYFSLKVSCIFVYIFVEGTFRETFRCFFFC